MPRLLHNPDCFIVSILCRNIYTLNDLWSRLFHSLNPLHTRRSRQPRVLQCLTLLLYELVSWAIPMKLLSGECQNIPFIGSSNGLVPLDSKLLSSPMLTLFCFAITLPQWVKSAYFVFKNCFIYTIFLAIMLFAVSCYIRFLCNKIWLFQPIDGMTQANYPSLSNTCIKHDALKTVSGFIKIKLSISF